MSTQSTPAFQHLVETESRSFLARQHVGRLAYSFKDHVDIEPISYTYDGGWIFGRTSIGTKLSTLAHHPWCAFEADEVSGPFEWTSVVAKGMFYILDPKSGSSDLYARAVASTKALMPDAFSVSDPTPQRSVLFGIHVNEITGRRARSQ